MAVVFQQSPAHMDLHGDGGMVCALSGVRCRPPYVVWTRPGAPDLYFDGRSVTTATLASVVADAATCRGVFSWLSQPEPGLIADLAALAYAPVGGLKNHSTAGQMAGARGMPTELREPIRKRPRRKPAPASSQGRGEHAV
jgi:hypothetical protein